MLRLIRRRRDSRPPGLSWRSSYWFSTSVIGLAVATDLLVYSIVIPVFPFRLEALGYSGVSALIGWLLFSFSAGLAVSTIPIAVFSEKFDMRTLPLNLGIILLIGSQVMLMLAPTYWVMCFARIIQGFSSSIVWIVGLALVCDMTPEQYIGRQLGIVMSGFSLGLLLGPSVGGALYKRFGYHGPFVFGIAAAVLDLIARLLIIERKDAMRWGVDPLVIIPSPSMMDEEQSRRDPNSMVAIGRSDLTSPAVNVAESGKINISLITVVAKLCKSPRALVALFATLIYGIVYAAMEPALPLHLQAVWSFNSSQVGLIFLAATIPTIFSSPLSGWLSDVYGAELVTVFCLTLAIPWWAVVSFCVELVLFILAFALESFFTSGVLSPLVAELSFVSRQIDGVGYAHVYGAFNLIYGIGSALGPVIGGQMYDHISRGWMAICLLAVGLLGVTVALTFWFAGDKPLLSRVFTSFNCTVCDILALKKRNVVNEVAPDRQR